MSRERQELAALRAQQKKEAEAYAKDKHELEEWKSLRANRQRNPDKYLKAEFGEDYYDKLTRLRVDGVPPADLVASEMDERFKAVQERLDAQEKSLEKKLQDASAKEAEQAKQQYLHGAIEHAKGNAEKYPLVHAFEEFGSVAQEIQAHFARTAKDGQPGELLTAEQAADAIEKRISEIGEKFKAHFAKQEEKAKPKDEKPKVSSTDFYSFQKRTENTPRREQPKEEGWNPPKNDKERMQRAFLAGEASLASRQH